MLRFFIPLFATLALPNSVEANWLNWVGRYRSLPEAKRACDKWTNNGINYKSRSPWGTFPRKSRFCQYDKEKRHLLGWEYQNVEENKIYINGRLDKKVTKRFYF